MGIADLLARFEAATKEEDSEQLHRLRTMIIRSVHLVSRGANRRNFAVRKGEEPTMLTNDIIGLDIAKTAAGVVTVGKANRDKVAEDLTTLAKKLSDPDADDQELAAAAKAITDMLTPQGKAEGEDMEEEPEDEEKAAAKKAKPYEEMDEEEKAKADAKKAKAEGEEGMEEDEEKGDAKKAKFKGPPGDATEEAAPEEEDEEKAKKAEDGAQVSDAFALIAKAGRRMSTGRLAIFKQALTLLQKLAEDLDPQEAKKVEAFMDVAKSLTQPDGPEEIGAGNGATSVAKGEERAPKEGWTFGVNINNPDLHRDTADPNTSFFEK